MIIAVCRSSVLYEGVIKYYIAKVTYCIALTEVSRGLDGSELGSA